MANRAGGWSPGADKELGPLRHCRPPVVSVRWEDGTDPRPETGSDTADVGGRTRRTSVTGRNLQHSGCDYGQDFARAAICGRERGRLVNILLERTGK